MRVENIQKRLGDLGEIIVDLVPDAGGEQGKRLDQPIDVRVRALVLVESEAAGNLRMIAGELGAELADEAQLALVIGEQLVRHQSAPCTRYC